jgi:hypothetical protein
MKKPSNRSKSTSVADRDETLPEYDFRDAVPNKFAARYASGSVVVVLEPDVAAAFPNSGEANAALRALAGIIRKHGTKKVASRRGLQ